MPNACVDKTTYYNQPSFLIFSSPLLHCVMCMTLSASAPALWVIVYLRSVYGNFLPALLQFVGFLASISHHSLE